MTGPMFRYDRPQAGRYRQFWQFDVEAIGDPGPAIDAEIIELGHRFYAEAGRHRRRGPRQLDRRPGLPAGVHRRARGLLPRPRRGAAAHGADRLERNALRLLDSKDPAMAELNAAAPRITDHLCDALRGALRRRSGAPRRARRPVPAGAGPRPRPRLLHPHGLRVLRRRAARASSRRWAAAAATTASSSCSAASPRPASASASGWTAWRSCWRSRAGGPSPVEPAPLAVVVGADPDDTIGAAARRHGSCARAGLRGPGRPRAAQARPPAGGRRQGRRALRGDPRRRARDGQVQLRDLQAGTQRRRRARRPRPGARPRRGRPHGSPRLTRRLAAAGRVAPPVDLPPPWVRRGAWPVLR